MIASSFDLFLFPLPGPAVFLHVFHVERGEVARHADRQGRGFHSEACRRIGAAACQVRKLFVCMHSFLGDF